MSKGVLLVSYKSMFNKLKRGESLYVSWTASEKYKRIIFHLLKAEIIIQRDNTYVLNPERKIK